MNCFKKDAKNNLTLLYKYNFFVGLKKKCRFFVWFLLQVKNVFRLGGKIALPPKKKSNGLSLKTFFFSTVEHTYMHGFSELLVIVYIWQ